MNRAILRQLIIKEWYLFRWLIGGTLVAGALTLALAATGRMSFTFGSISFMVAVVVLGAILASFGVQEEKKNRTLLFVLSMPLSPMQYAWAKLAANGTAFLVPWLILLVAAVATIAVTPIPDGMIPFTVALMCHFVLYYVLIFAVALVYGTNVWMTSAIVLGNVSINFFIFLLIAIPSIGEPMEGPVAVWSPALWAVITAELGLIALTLALALYFHSRKEDFV